MLIHKYLKHIFEKASKVELRRAIRFVWESGPIWTIANVVMLVVQGVLPLLTLYLTKLVLDAVTTGLTSEDKQAAFIPVLMLVGLLGLVTLVAAAARQIGAFFGDVQAEHVTDHMYEILHAKSVEADLEYYENAQYYDILHRAQQEAPYRPYRIVTGLFRIGQNGISLLAMFGLLIAFHWGIGLLLFLASLPGIIARLNYSSQLYEWQREQTPTTRKARYYNWMLTGEAHAKENRLFDLGGLFMKRSSELRAHLRKERIRMSARYYLVELGTQASGILAVFIAYAFIAYQAVLGNVTLGDMVMYYQAFQRGQEYLKTLLGGLAGLYEDSLFLSNLYEFLDLERRVPEPEHPKRVPRPMQTGIIFDRVRFQYPNGTREAVEEVSLTLRPGEVIALVGENGSGKTTLMKLLCRLYDPTEGKITIDGIDLREFDTKSLRREVSIIFQDYVHYNLSARENIWTGDISQPLDNGKIISAAIYAGAHDVITSLNNGYDTLLGKQFDNGEELSIGQWQKIALARAFLRDAQVIVLDEPTSAMDPKAEYEVFGKFRELLEDRTAILISHRLSTVKMADRIYVLQNGRIIENGTHDELVQRAGTYANLYETQAQQYR